MTLVLLLMLQTSSWCTPNGVCFERKGNNFERMYVTVTTKAPDTSTCKDSTEEYCIEELTDAEVKAVKDANKAIADAQLLLSAAESAIKTRVTGRSMYDWSLSVGCNNSYKTVDIKGKYAIVRTVTFSSCGANSSYVVIPSTSGGHHE